MGYGTEESAEERDHLVSDGHFAFQLRVRVDADLESESTPTRSTDVCGRAPSQTGRRGAAGQRHRDTVMDSVLR